MKTIWQKDPSIERSIDRLNGKLGQMECNKQLVQILKKIYKKNMTILDFGCAAGHYYKELTKLNKNINYTGYDVTSNYILYAKKFFKNNKNVKFRQNDLLNLKRDNEAFDIVYCCNVLLHLPSIQTPIKNLLSLTNKYCLIRTLVSEDTHLSKYIYKNKKNVYDLSKFTYQNTYSYEYIKKTVRKYGRVRIEFIDDKFNFKKINKDSSIKRKFSGNTRAIEKIQISGQKVYSWKWILIKK